jgi:hypothetical protein
LLFLVLQLRTAGAMGDRYRQPIWSAADGLWSFGRPWITPWAGTTDELEATGELLLLNKGESTQQQRQKMLGYLLSLAVTGFEVVGSCRAILLGSG